MKSEMMRRKGHQERRQRCTGTNIFAGYDRCARATTAMTGIFGEMQRLAGERAHNPTARSAQWRDADVALCPARRGRGCSMRPILGADSQTAPLCARAVAALEGRRADSGAVVPGRARRMGDIARAATAR